MEEFENYNGVYIEKVTKVKRVFMEHNYDKRRKFFKKTLYEIQFDNGDMVYLQLRPKKYQNCFNGVDFKLINTKFTKRKIVYEEIL